MPVLIALLGLVATAGFWAWRLRMAGQALNDVAGLAGDVMAAARRLGFRRRANVHPVDSVDEPALAISAIGLAFLDLAAMPTAEQLATLRGAIAARLSVSAVKAEEMVIVGRWLVSECKTADAAVTRLTKRLYRLDQAGFAPLLAVLGDMGSAAPTGLSPRQREALDEIARVMRLN